MILLEPGYNGSALDAGYIRIDGADYRISELSIVEDRSNGKLGINRFDTVLYVKQGYAQFTTDDTLLTPMASYDALLEALNGLNAYYFGGVNATKVLAAASTNALLIKPGPTKLHSIMALNPAGADAYLKIYDLGDTPVPGTDTPVMTFDTKLLPAGPVTFGAAVDFHNGLAMAITAVADDSDNTAVGAGDVMVTVVWEGV